MLTDRNVVRFVKSLLNGMDCGVPVAAIDCGQEEHKIQLKRRIKIQKSESALFPYPINST